jgi:hypothetical protein
MSHLAVFFFFFSFFVIVRDPGVPLRLSGAYCR